jgi:hypothetical protein
MSQPPWLNDDDMPQWITTVDVNGRAVKIRVSGRGIPSPLAWIRFVDPVTGQTVVCQAQAAWSDGPPGVDDDAVLAEIVR